MNFTRLSRVVAISIGTLAVSGAVLAASLPRGIGTQEQDKTGVVADKRPVVGPNSIGVGAYDPHGDFSSDPNVKFEHLFLPWEDVDLSSLAKADDYALQRGRSLIITVEPWSWSVDWRVSPETLVQGILAGKYDVNMAAICTAAADLKSPVIIRWAQEMDETDGQFSWAKWAPSEYIKAYERMVTECRESNTTAKFMWSPKGNKSLQSFYPGAGFVDYVGLSVFGLQQYDQDQFGKARTFAEALEPGYRLASSYGKPIIVAELGYEGDARYTRQWAETVATADPRFPLLEAVVYFNDREVYPWPYNYGRPNWRVVSPVTN